MSGHEHATSNEQLACPDCRRPVSSPDPLAALRERHRQEPLYDGFDDPIPDQVVCHADGKSWPCDFDVARQALDAALDRERALAAMLEEAASWLPHPSLQSTEGWTDEGLASLQEFLDRLDTLAAHRARVATEGT